MHRIFALFSICLIVMMNSGEVFAGSGVVWGKVLSAQLGTLDGSVSAPSHTFTAELGTGMYRGATGNLAFTVLGSKACDFLYLSASNVNIGCGTPAVSGQANFVNFDRSFNGTTFITYSNSNTTTLSAIVFNIVSGTSGTNGTLIENWAQATGLFFSGMSALMSGTNQTGLGIGTTASFAPLLFMQGGRIASAEVARIDIVRHWMWHQNTAPAIGACGTSPAIGTLSTDQAGFITVGTGGVATSCAITFNTTWTSLPMCFVESDTDIVAHKVVTTTTTMTVTFGSAITASSRLSYHCMGTR